MQERVYLNLGEKNWKNPVQMKMHKRGLFSMHNISIGVREVVSHVTVLVLPLHLVRLAGVERLWLRACVQIFLRRLA
jgi:hypothetical protein